MTTSNYIGWVFQVGFTFESLFVDWDELYQDIPMYRINRDESMLVFVRTLAAKIKEVYEGSAVRIIYEGPVKAEEVDTDPRITPSITWRGGSLTPYYDGLLDIVHSVYDARQWMIKKGSIR